MENNYVKTFEDFEYKSDEDIEKEYTNFELEEIKFENRDMSYMYPDDTFEGYVVWNFGEEVSGGFESSTEDFIYTTIPDDEGKCFFKYVVNNWYPEPTYMRMVVIITNELKDKYGYDFIKVKSLPTKD